MTSNGRQTESNLVSVSVSRTSACKGTKTFLVGVAVVVGGTVVVVVEGVVASKA